MEEERPKVKPDLRQARKNFSGSDLPFFSRMQVAMKNNWTKMRTRQNCCGNYGEPGC